MIKAKQLASDYQAYLSSLSPHVHPFLEQQLDWDHGGVDVDLNEIADHMLDWEDRLSAHLGLTRTDIRDIKLIHLYESPLQRREALKKWRNKCGLNATYGNLLKLCIETGHTECAQVICDILKRKAPSLEILWNELVSVKKKWREICIQLNVPNKILRDFTIFDDPLTKGLVYWLDGNTDVPITWGSVVAALASPHVGEYLLAEYLREKWTTSKESEEIHEKTDGAPSLRTLLNELLPVRKRWREICIQLNIPYKKLHDFVFYDDPLTEGLEYWLDGNTDVPITWGSVVAALASPYVGEYILAENLKEKWTTSKESEEIYEKTDGAPSLKTLLNELAPIRYMWQEICIQLNIPNKILRDFGIFGDPLTEGLDYWLNGNTDVPITWGSVVAALASPHVGEYLLAENLREKWTTSKESEEIYKKTDGGDTIESALLVASQNGQVEEVKSLLGRNAQIDFQTNDGSSALHIASQNGHVDVAKLLLEKGAKVDLLNNDQCSPLMIACERESTDVAQVLLDHDADTYLRNEEGQTALEIAKEKNHVNIISLFAELKEKVDYPGILFSEGIKKESITSDKKTINLEDVGISITFPENSLPPTDPPLEVNIQPCFSGPFEMPDGIESVSPAYIIKYNRRITFLKDVILKIQHYANLQTEEDCENMVFLSARCIPEYRGSSPIYVFKEITDSKGLFRPGQEKPFGENKLKHFSIITIGKKLLNWISGNSSKLYSARLFRTEKSTVFCMCLFQSQYMQQCEKVIASKYPGIQEPIEYNGVTLSSNEVTIRASENNEWKVTFQKMKILKTEIEIQEVYQDNFEELLELNYPPRIDIGVTLTPVTLNPTPLELCIKGLNEDYIFNLPPDHYVTKHHAISPQVLPHSSVATQDKPCDLKNVKNRLKDLSPKKYFDLGLELGIEKSDFEKFEESHPNDPKRVLADIIDQWLRNNPDHSWGALRTALEAIDEKTLAHNIILL